MENSRKPKGVNRLRQYETEVDRFDEITGCTFADLIDKSAESLGQDLDQEKVGYPPWRSKRRKK